MEWPMAFDRNNFCTYAQVPNAVIMSKRKKDIEIKEGKSTKADFHHGSTTQGGSDFGQGSMQLGKDQKQGSESNSGSNDGEQGWDNEALRRSDERP
jgi:hypothetical protein